MVVGRTIPASTQCAAHRALHSKTHMTVLCGQIPRLYAVYKEQDIPLCATHRALYSETQMTVVCVQIPRLYAVYKEQGTPLCATHRALHSETHLTVVCALNTCLYEPRMQRTRSIPLSLEPTTWWCVSQIPRLYAVYKEQGIIANFEEMLDHLFSPLFEVTRDPTSHPQLHLFLKQVIA